MTGREYLNKTGKIGLRIFWQSFLGSILFFLFLNQLIPEHMNAIRIVLSLLLFSSIIGGSCWASKYTRCPHCKQRQGSMTNAFQLPSNVQYCPHCGADFDSEIKANKWIDPTVKTPVESGNEQGTAGHP